MASHAVRDTGSGDVVLRGKNAVTGGTGLRLTRVSDKSWGSGAVRRSRRLSQLLFPGVAPLPGFVDGLALLLSDTAYFVSGAKWVCTSQGPHMSTHTSIRPLQSHLGPCQQG